MTRGKRLVVISSNRRLRSYRPTTLNNDTLAHLLSLDDKNSKPEDWDWVAVRLVCRQWRAVAENTARIWSYIYRWRDSKRVEAFLRLSKKADLTVNLEGKYVKYKSEDGFMLKHSVGIILQHLHRISFLRLPMDKSWLDDFNTLLERPAPRLRHIHFYSLQDHREGVCTFPVTTAVLRNVILHQVQPSPISFLAGLSLLHIDCGFSKSLYLSDVMSAVQKCPELTSLSIQTRNVTHRDAYLVPEKAIQLPFLRFLEIKVPEFSDYILFLQSIHAPKLSCCKLVCRHTLTTEDIGKFGVFSQLLAGFCDIGPVKFRQFEAKMTYAKINEVGTWNFDSPKDLKCLALGLRYDREEDRVTIFQSLRNIFGKSEQPSML